MLEPKLWPKVWQSLNRIDSPGANVLRDSGARTRIAKTGDIIYSCPCGSMFGRKEGELIAEARAWVTAHTPHLPESERVE